MMTVVFILALLQYRWSVEVSRAEQERLKAALTTGVQDFTQEFSYDFQRLCESLEIEPQVFPFDFEARLLSQFSNWTRATSRPSLVAGLYIWRIEDPEAPYLESLHQETDRFRKVMWPAELGSLHQFLSEKAQRLSSVVSDREAMYYPWTFYEDAPALIRPLFEIAGAGSELESRIQPAGMLIVRLDEEFLRRVYLPELLNRDFETSGLAAAIRTAGEPHEPIYLPEPGFPVTTSSPDAVVNLFDAIADEAMRRGHPVLQASSEPRQWQLVVQHPAGSLVAGVASWRRRNLAISFGLLAILAVSIVFIVSVARRAKRLARLQLEFVAGVSHELCTPLAVINSAAENLVDGVVDDPRQLREYGGMIRDQSRRLERLVDEVLLFAAGRFDRSKYEMRPVQVGPIVTQSLVLSESMLRDTGFAVKREVDEDLPLVVADPAAVSKCIENLVSNAMKYAGAKKWIAVRARAAGDSTQPEVQISVEDQGIGIEATDLPHIFEPFYRVKAVRDGQIRGVGLGLHLVKRMMEAMGGHVSVWSEVGRGTAFTLHFPVKESADIRQGEAA